MGHGIVTRRIRRPTAGVGIVAIATAKALDAGTTWFGLSEFDRTVELNPVIRAGFDTVGVVPALFWFSLASVLLVALVTETGVVLWERADRSPRLIRYVGYGLPTLTAMSAATHNGILIVRLWS